MGKQKLLFILCVAVAISGLSPRISPSRALAGEKVSPAITGPFRDPANVPKKRTITKADREAAAQRLAAGRAAALKSPPPDAKAPSPEKGGPKR